MSYRITVTRMETVTKKFGKEWKVVGEEQAKGDDNKPYLKDLYGYTPEIEKEATEEVEVLRQTVTELDMIAVIKAINGLAGT